MASVASHAIVLSANISAHHITRGVDPSHGLSLRGPADLVFSDTGKPFVIPVLGLLIGAAMMQVEKIADAGKLVLYFGAQSFMNIFMGWVLGTHITLAKGTELENGHTLEHDLKGCPAGFALTALQQVVSFIVFMIYFGAVYFTPKKYTPKPITSRFQVGCIVIFGCVFALNIALNNFSLGYISIAVNLIIRSCLPLTTFMSQQGLAQFNLYPKKPFRIMEIFLMVIGVLCAAVFTIATIMADSRKGGKNAHGEDAAASEILGVVMCILSLLCGSLNLALAGVLGAGEETKLNVFDTVAYMAPPATLFLLPICFIQKPVPGEWAHVFGVETMSDIDILMGVASLNPGTLWWLLVSGVFSFVYNIIQFSIVHTLSPSATAFGGNFNKAALIFMTLLFPFLQVHANPPMPYIGVIWGAVICNICAFSYYSYLQIVAKQEADEKKAKLVPSDDQDDENECLV